MAARPFRCSFALLILISTALEATHITAQEASQTTRSVTPAPSAVSATPPGAREIAAYVGGRTIYRDDLDTIVRAQLLELLDQTYRLRRAALEKEIDRLLIEREATVRGVPISVVQRDLASTREITEAEVEEAYQKAKGRLATVPEIEARDRIRQIMQQSGQRRAYHEKMVLMRKAAGVEVVLRRPSLSVEEFTKLSGPTLGTPASKVRLVVFSDYECPYCRTGEAQIAHMLTQYPKDIEVVYKQFPLPNHSQAQKAAEAALCANEQGRFRPFHDSVFAHSRELSPQRLLDIAAQVQLDVAAFAACLNTGKMAAVVARDREQGESIGVRATPTFLINGEIFRGLPSPGELEVVIQQALRGRKAPAN